MIDNKINMPLIIAGPCLAESFELLDEVAQALHPLAQKCGSNFYFKASFDKANRTSGDSERGPGLARALKWFAEIRDKYNMQILTDIHEPDQAQAASEVCSGLQIPAFLCRQTDLLIAAIKTNAFVNIKKGQFISPQAMKHIIKKTESIIPHEKRSHKISITERGSTFGYGDLIVDMRSFKTMAENNVPIVFDITHSIQKPPSNFSFSSGCTEFAPTLARCAAASSYVNGFFLEIHTNPKKALSDSKSQLNIKQGLTLLKQTIDIWNLAQNWKDIDSIF